MYDATFWGNLVDTVLTFLGTLAWPTAIVIVVLIFRRQIEVLILHIKKGKLFGFEFEIGDKVQAYSPDDRKIYTIPLEKPAAEVESKIHKVSSEVIAMSKERAERRLEEDTRLTGIKRGRLFQHEDGIYCTPLRQGFC